MSSNAIIFAFLLTASLCLAQSENHIFRATSILEARNLPALSNGILGYIAYSDTVHLIGVHSGPPNNTRRARVPNYGRVQYEFCGPYTQGAEACNFSFDARRALFRTNSVHETNRFSVDLLTYPHRVFTNTIVNHLTITRTDRANTTASIRVRLFASPGPNSADFTLNDEVRDLWNTTEPYTIYPHVLKSDATNTTFVYAFVQDVPEAVTLPAGQTEITFTWIAAVGTNVLEVMTEFNDAMRSDKNALFASHTVEWEKFWSESGIEIVGNDELARTVYSSLYTVAAAQISTDRILPQRRPNGLSPDGLGLNDYQGHTFWDSEIWVHPVSLLLNQDWSRSIVQYRVDRRAQAGTNSRLHGHQGVLYPVQSDHRRGEEMSVDGVLAATKNHITGNVAFAIRQHFFATLDSAFLRVGNACSVVLDAARFWDNRMQHNEFTDRYDINGTTGPNGRARNISNNAYTNVLAAHNLFFGDFAACYCDTPAVSVHGVLKNWTTVARSIVLGYSNESDYTPAFNDYLQGEAIREADTVLVSYPLQYPLAASTQLNNVGRYESALNNAGPSTSYAVHNIIRLGLGVLPTLEQFERTFKPYVRAPFYVWAESDAPNALQPRVSASAAFLQLILNGYAGIRLHDDRLEIAHAALPPSVTKLSVNGFKYLGGSYALEITSDTIKLRVHKNDSNTNIYINGFIQLKNIEEFSFNAVGANITLRPINQDFGQCTYTPKTIGHRTSSASTTAVSAIAFLLVALHLF